ncbi:MAG: TonB-dependent receptor [Bacteroidales bacterium]
MKKNLLLLFLLFSTLFSVSAQNITLTGSVKDSTGEPLIGAFINVSGTKNGTIADVDGNYSIKVKGNDKVEFSYVGLKPVVVLVNKRNKIDVVLEEDSKLLDEVVAIGYGTAKKSDLSGSVASLKADDIVMGDPSDLAKGLSGKIAGVNVMQNDGAPGGGVSINVRGANSFSTSSQPLYVLDGIPYESSSVPSSTATSGNVQEDSPLSLINPSDIESIEVLKDASATAIYGSRGANGVVLITTKKGKKGRDKIEFSSSFSTSHITKTIDVLDAYDYANYCNEQVDNSNYYDGQTVSYSYSGTWNSTTGKYSPAPSDFLNPGIYTDPTGTYTDIVGVADWQDVIFQTSNKTEYNLRLSGGDEKGNYMISGNYLTQDGVVKNSGFTRYTLRSNINRNLRDWLKAGTNIAFTNSLSKIAKTTTGSDAGILRSALVYPPTYDPELESTEVSDELSWLSGNPYTYINNAKDDLESINVSTSSYIEVRILPTLKFRQNIGIGYANKRRNTYFDSNTREGMYTNGLASQADNYRTSYVSESLLTWDQSFNDGMHKFNLLGGFTAEYAEYGSKSMSATEFPTDLTGEYDMSAGLDPKTLQSAYGENSLISLIMRGNYTLGEKYIFTATFRRDGSSKFVEDNKFANFYSGAAAWRLSEEDFIKELDIFSNLKLRGSIGETGNQGISSYQTFTELGVNNYPFGGTLSSGGAVYGNITSSDLRWETTRQYDLGIDIGVLNNRVSLTVDYYNKNTRDLLQTLSIPNSTGYTSMLVNSGNVTNEGIEIAIGLTNILDNKKWKWDITGNISFNHNSISGLDSDQFAYSSYSAIQNVFIQRNGLSIGSIYGYVEDGFYDNIAEVLADPEYQGLTETEALKMVGEIKYLDIDGEPGITSGDMTVIGDTNAEFTYGLSSSLSWNNFTLSVFFQGSQGNDIFNATLISQNMSKSKNITQEAYDTRWTAENAENALWPKATNEATRIMLISDRYVEDGSYLKLKNVNLEYRFHLKNKKIFDMITVYANATNLFTITEYSGYDPEMSSFGTNSALKGVDYYAYPSCMTFTLGLKLLF